MLLKAKIDNNKITFKDKELYNQVMSEVCFDGNNDDVEITIKKAKNTRSSRQNRALHLWYKQVADALNENGIDIRTFFKDGVEVQWNAEIIKGMWKIVQKIMFDKESTTKLLKSKEIDEIFDVFNRKFAEKGLHVPFPSIYNMIEKDII